MQTHEVVRKNKNRKRKVVGRGGRHAKTSGRGTKGQNSRAGNKKRPELRDIIKNLPKLRGYRFNSFAVKPATVSLGMINDVYKAGESVTPDTLVEKGLVKTAKGLVQKIKILSDGTLDKKLSFENCVASKAAKAKIEAAGGTIK